jgi:hypothetical protein
MSTFTKFWYAALVCLLVLGCSSLFLGDRDTPYTGVREVPQDEITLIKTYPDWWEATLLLRKCDGTKWCSAVAVNNTGYKLVDYGEGAFLQPVTYLVTARHCTDVSLGTASEIVYRNDGSVLREIKHEILDVWNHPTKDFAILEIKDWTLHMTPVCVEKLPIERQDYIIGYRGVKFNDYFKLGKHISPAYAYKGQSGGGVFSPGYGLHSIVSTHTDGVNILEAAKEMRIINSLGIYEVEK